MKKLTALMLSMVMLASLFAGCKKTETDPGKPVDPVTPSTEDKLDTKQYLNNFITAEPQSLDIHRSSDTYGSTIMANTTEALTRLDEVDGGSKVVPAGAKEWSTSADGTVWTFKLVENKWLDGTPVTANDYVYAYQRLADPATGAPLGYFLDPIKNYKEANAGTVPTSEIGVKAIDDLTLEITLAAPTPHFISLTYQRFMAPMQKTKIEALGEKYGSEAQNAESNGPFVVTSWVHNSELILEKNKNYWNADAIKLEKISYRIIGDENTYYNEFETGGIDVVSTGKQEWIEKFEKKTDAYKVTYPNANVTFMFFNTKDPIFQNENIRKAFTLGIDRAEMNDVVYSSLREPATGWVATAMAVGSTNFRGEAGDIIAEMAAKEGDPKALLLKGMGELGLGSDPTTLKLKFSLGGVDQFYRTMGEYLQQAYKASLGVNLEIDFAEWPVFSSNVEKGDFQMGSMGWGAFYNDPIDVLAIFKAGSGSINTGWESAEFDAILDKAAIELDEAKRIDLFKQAEKMIVNEVAIVSPIAYSTTNAFRYNYVKGLNETSMSSIGSTKGFTSGRE